MLHACDLVPTNPLIPPSQRRPLRIGFVMHVMQVAGAEVLVRETIHRLGNLLDPVIFCLDDIGSMGKQLQEEGVEVLNLGRQPGIDRHVGRRLAREIGSRKLDVLHAHQYSPFFYAAWARLLSVGRRFPRIIFTEHGRHYPDIVSPKRRAFNRLLLDRCAEAVNACSHFSAQALVKIEGFAGNRIEVIENGIDLQPYAQAKRAKSELKVALGWSKDRRHIIHIARHHPVKDQQTLINAFALVAAKLRDVDLVLVGDGPLRPALEQQSKTLQLTDRILFTGIRQDVPLLLQSAELFVLTSLSEAASLTLLEAMGAGLPVVVSAVGGNPEIVRDQQEGFHFPRGDAERCAQAMQKILEDESLARQFGASAQQRVAQYYQLDRTIARYYRLYCQLTPGCRRG